MKSLRRLIPVAVLIATSTLVGYAADPTESSYNQPLAEQNLLIGIASDNLGLRLSAASILAEVGTSRSVVPLMAMLHNGNEEERIVAALALSKIGDGRGEFAVKRAAMFDPSEKVQRMAAWYYNQYAIPKAESVAPELSSLSWISDFTPYPEDYDGSQTSVGISH